MITQLFPLGQVVATPGALSLLDEAGVEPISLLMRHATGDWGEIDKHDAGENELGLREGFRVMSVYPVSERKVWVITEADRSVTTLLLPEEY